MTHTKSVLIVGGSGYLGSYLAKRLRDGYKVYATYFKKPAAIPGVSFIPMDVENRNWVKRVVYTTQPSVVIYVAGSNDMQEAEKNARNCERLHADGPTTLAGSTDIMQPRFIYLSNSYVFDGTKGNYHEQDTILPGTVLGRMKSGGENAMKSKCLNYIILRSSPTFGRSNGLNLSFFDRLRMTLDRGKRIELSTDELHAFAPLDGLCDLIIKLIGSGVKNRVLHYGGLTKMNHFEFGQAFAKRFGYDPNLVVARTASQNTDGQPLFDFSLNFTQAVDILKIKPFLLEEGFDLIEQQLIPKS
ncbi:MAG: sugar nucleotide-binding protein [Bdellovibrio sp.]|nr:sugar nucleotide-binding protein [Bdellovibrio sp.]